MTSLTRSIVLKIGRAVLGFGIVILAWWYVAETSWAQARPQNLWLAHPQTVIERLGEVIFADFQNLPEDKATVVEQDRGSIRGSIRRVVPSFIMVFLLGVPLGLLLGYASSLFKIFEGPLDFWRAIPPIAVLPVCFFIFDPVGDRWFFNLFSPDDKARIASVLFGCIPILVIQVADTVRSIPIERRDFANQIGSTIFFKLRWLLLYELLPTIFVSLRTVLSFCVVIIVAGEMAWGAGLGLGDRLTSARYAEDPLPASYAFAIIAGMIAYVGNILLHWVERRAITWN